jgi:hypothetical protein
VSASTTDELRRALDRALAHTDGPLLIEMRLA